MREARLVAVLGAVLCLVFPPAWAQGEFPLRHEEISKPTHPMASGVRAPASCSKQRYPEISGVPKGMSANSHYYRVKFGQREVLMILDHKPDPPKLYVDTDGDKDFRDEEGHAGVATGMVSMTFGDADFGLFKVGTAGGSKGPPLTFRVHGRYFHKTADTQLTCFPAGCRSGQVSLGGKAYKVGIVDGDYDGRYDGAFSTESRLGARSASDDRGGGKGLLCVVPNGLEAFAKTDRIGIDLDMDGKIEPYGQTEVFPLVKFLRVDGTYYSVKAAANGSSVSFKKADPEMGKLELEMAERTTVEMLLFSDSGAWKHKGGPGIAEMAVGDYVIQRITIQKTDERGVEWKLNCYGGTGGVNGFSVRSGATSSLNLGEPLRAKTEVRRQGQEELVVDLYLIGKAGERYEPGGLKDGKAFVHRQRFKILDESGKAVRGGAFEYSCGGVCRYSGKMPRGLKGKFQVQATVNVGSFEVICEPEWHTLD